MRLGAFLAAAVMCFTVVPGVADAQTKKMDFLRVAYPSSWEAIPAIVGIERGYFAGSGLVVSGMRSANANATADSLIAGTSDIALVPQRTLLIMAGKKLKFGVVAMNGWGTEIELIVPKTDKKTKSLTGLKGKRIAITRGSAALPVLMRLLNQKKMAIDDVKVVQVTAKALLQTLKTGGADAVIDLRQLTSVMVTKGEARVVATNRQIADAIGRIGAVPVLANARVLEKQSPVVQKFVHGWAAALSHIRQNPDDAARLLVIYFHRQGTKFPLKLAKTWIQMVNYDRFAWTKSDIADAEYNGWGLVMAGVMKTQPKIGPYIRNEYAQNAAKALRTPAKKKAPRRK